MTMQLLLLGFNFRTHSIAEREALSVPAETIPVLLKKMRQVPGVNGVVHLSTCHRLELYAAVEKGFDAALLAAVWAGGKTPAYVHHDEKAFHHLLRVASGLDSMVLGENEVLGQVKKAYMQALELKVSGPLLNFIFQQALRLAKQVRTETGIVRHPLSLSSIAILLIEQIFGDIEKVKALVVGKGEMGRQTADLLSKRSVGKLVVANRSVADNTTHSLDKLDLLIAESDVAVVATRSEKPLVTQSLLAPCLADREDPLLLIDLGSPRNVDPAAAEMSPVYLYNVDDLKTIAEKNLALRKGEAAVAEVMLQKAVAVFAMIGKRGTRAVRGV